jgi:hypothetical protein
MDPRAGGLSGSGRRRTASGAVRPICPVDGETLCFSILCFEVVDAPVCIGVPFQTILGLGAVSTRCTRGVAQPGLNSQDARDLGRDTIVSQQRPRTDVLRTRGAEA